MRSIGACLLLIVLAAGCSREPDEAALRESIAAMQQAVEQRSLSGVMDRVTEDFGGSHGLDRQMLQRMLQGQIIANAKIGATIGPMTVEVHGERATASFSLVLTGGSGRFIPERGRAYPVVSGWRIEDGVWKVYFAEWEARGAD